VVAKLGALHGKKIMTLKVQLCAAAVALCTAATASPAQQSEPALRQPSQHSGDPATVGAGPTSRSPGETNYEAPKGAPVTTDDKGVTTTNSGGVSRSGNAAPLDQGNDSFDTVAPDKK
jgi:hypothetical protein